MSDAAAKREPSGKFRGQLLLAMMLIVAAITGVSLYFAQRTLAGETERDRKRQFQAELARRATAQEIRHAGLAERCRALVRRPRIHAALEDNALDLLYPSAKDELRDLLDGDDLPPGAAPYELRARFYRFLDAAGSVIPPPDQVEVGELTRADEHRLALDTIPAQLQLGYLLRTGNDGAELVDEVVSMPIISMENGDTIAALVVGFEPAEPGPAQVSAGALTGLWLAGRLHLPTLSADDRQSLAPVIARTTQHAPEAGTPVLLARDRYLLFANILNPGSHFPPAWEVCLFPLAEAEARARQIRWQILSAGAIALLGGLLASHFLSGRLAVPVEQLAVDSAENRTQRQRAEAALKLTSEELQRSARFSADASHQLKTPVTVLRAGLEELLARPGITSADREELAALIHQTFRLGTIIEDLLLLSRMEAGRLRLELAPLDLSALIDGWLDDLSALPDELDLQVESSVPPGLCILGERRYTSLILQNLLENARKYNERGGSIRITTKPEGEMVALVIGNSGPTIPPGVREHIFERFHRGAVGENVPGYGLGLNLARELARLHGGELFLSRSEHGWTEFEVCFRLAPTLAPADRSA